MTAPATNLTSNLDQRIVVHEYTFPLDHGKVLPQYVKRGLTPFSYAAQYPGSGSPDGWSFTGRSFVLYASDRAVHEPGARTPICKAYYERWGHMTHSLTSSSSHPGYPGMTDRIIGYARTDDSGGAVGKLLTEMEATGLSDPHVYAYGTYALREGWVPPAVNPPGTGTSAPPVWTAPMITLHTKVEADPNAGGLPKVHLYRDANCTVRLEDIEFDSGDWQVCIKAPTEGGWALSTFSMGDGTTGSIEHFDGSLAIESWTPQEMVLLNANHSNTQQTFSFNIVMHNGSQFANLDPKFINRSKSSAM